MDDRDEVRRRSEQLMADLAPAADDPGRWTSLPAGDLERLLFRQCVLFDLLADERNRIGPLMRLYHVCVERLDVDARSRVLERVGAQIEQLEQAPNGLLPFLYEDPHPAIVSGASLQSAVLMPLRDGDPLSGPRTLCEMADQLGDEQRRGHVLGGLLLLGDRRVLPLLDARLPTFSPEGLVALAHPISGYVHAAHVEFLVGALERLPEPSWGGIAAGLVRLRQTARRDTVMDVERKLPSWAHEDGPQVRVLREWPLDAFAAEIGPRLRALAAREHEPRVLPAVLESWGIAGCSA